MWLTWLFTVASLTTRRSAISALDRPAAMSVRTAPDLPAGDSASHVADGELTLPSADVTADLALLTGWARANHLDLTLLLRTPRTLIAGLILPGALQLGWVQHLGQVPPRTCSRPGWRAWSCWAR